MNEEHKTDPSELRYPTVPPTLPSGIYAVPHEVLQHLIDGQLAIHEEIRALKIDAKKFIDEITKKVESLEGEINTIKSTCSAKHGNGQQRLPLI